MKKFFITLFVFFITTVSVVAKDMRFIQVDSCLYTTANRDSFNKLIEKINNEKNIEFVIFSGDNIAKPNKTYLDNFIQDLKNLKPPYYIILGNKELNKQKEFGKAEYIEYLAKKNRFYKKNKSPNYVFEKNKWVFIVVDGSKEVIPTSGGYYKFDVLDWLSEQLNIYKDKKVVIIQHFPIIPPTKKETKYTYKAEEYLEFLKDYKNVKAVVSGNFNANSEKTVNGILHISTADAPMYRIIDILDYETELPIFWSTIKE